MTDANSRDSWSILSSLVDTLLDAEPEKRAALIDELSAGDAERRTELVLLLAECETERELLSKPAAERFAALFADYVPSFPDALAERYSLVKELGRGGMATVYLARDLKHARDVAVKVVNPGVAAALGADKFLREIEIVAQLHHPHIVPLYDSGDADGSLFYVMPYKDEPSLRQRLVRDGALPIDDALQILREVCDGLAFAHEHGIVHRDIKPDNVLLSGRHAMITDFGVAEAVNEAAASDSAVAGGISFGTPAYMAPEQISVGARVDHRTDIYSLGVLAYELIAGQPPFAGRARADVLTAHLKEIPLPLSELRPGVPAPVNELVMKCLEKWPEDRWQSAGDLVQRLDAGTMQGRSNGLQQWWFGAIGVAAAVVIATLVWRSTADPAAAWRTRWANARIERLTDFPGSEVDAAISRDGNFVAFLADRDSVFDGFIARVGSGQFVNLTKGSYPQLFNEDVRNIGFAADSSHVWMRVGEIASPARISMVSRATGTTTPYLDSAVMAVWSPDGSRLAYHGATPGDPIFLADSDGRNARRIFVAPVGVHNHYLSWSPDGRFIYFSQGSPPDEMDIWRMPSSGGSPERVSRHNARVAYPVLIDDRTLIYSATADDGTGPWLYMMNVDDRISYRVTAGIEHYASIAASAGHAGRNRRLVATVSNPSVQLWTAPITDSVAGEQLVQSMTLPTARSAAPRFGRDSTLWYLAARAGADGVWRMVGGTPTEVWSAARGAVVGAVAPSPDGKAVCFPVRRHGRSTLYCTNGQGTDARAVAESLDVRGAASWSPDGKFLAVASKEGTGTRVFKVSLDGAPPVRLTDSVSTNPVWSLDGKFIVYSGTPRGRSVPLKAVTPDGHPHQFPELIVDRIGDSYRFMPNGRTLIVKLGGFRRQDFWLFDVTTGARRALTALRSGESLHRFDVSPDGKRIVFERVRYNSDIVLIELPN